MNAQINRRKQMKQFTVQMEQLTETEESREDKIKGEEWGK